MIDFCTGPLWHLCHLRGFPKLKEDFQFYVSVPWLSSLSESNCVPTAQKEEMYESQATHWRGQGQIYTQKKENQEEMKACLDEMAYYEKNIKDLGLKKMQKSWKQQSCLHGLSPSTFSKCTTGKVKWYSTFGTDIFSALALI